MKKSKQHRSRRSRRINPEDFSDDMEEKHEGLSDEDFKELMSGKPSEPKLNTFFDIINKIGISLIKLSKERPSEPKELLDILSKVGAHKQHLQDLLFQVAANIGSRKGASKEEFLAMVVTTLAEDSKAHFNRAVEFWDMRSSTGTQDE